MTTDPIIVPLEVQAKLNQIKSEANKASNEARKIMSDTMSRKDSDAGIARMHESLSQADKATSNLINHLEELANTSVVNPTYKQMQDYLGEYEKESVALSKTLSTLNGKFETAKNKVSELSVELSEAKDNMVMTADYSSTVSQLSKVQSAVDAIDSKMKNLKASIELNDKSLKIFRDDLEGTTVAYNKSLAEKGEKSIDTKALKVRMQDLTNYLDEATNKASEYREELAKSETELENLVKQSEELSKKKDEIAKSGKAYEYVDPARVSELEDAFESANAEVEDLVQNIAETEVALDDAQEEAQEYRNILSEMRESGADMISGAETPEFEELFTRAQSSVDNLKVKTLGFIDKLRGGLGDINAQSLLQLTNSRNIATMVGRILQLVSKISPALKGAAGLIGIIVAALLVVVKILTTIGKLLVQYYKLWFKAVGKIAKTIISGVLTPLKQIPNIIKSISTGFVRLSGIILKGVGSAILTVTSLLKNMLSLVGRGIVAIGKGIGGKLSNIFGSFTSALTSAFDFSGTIQDIADDYVSSVVSARDEAQRQLDDYVAQTADIDLNVNPQAVANIERLKNKVRELDNQLQHTNNTMGRFGSKSAMVTFQNLIYQINDLKASLQQLRYSWTAAFAPLASVVIPYLQKLVSWLITVVNTIGQFIAALTGHGTYLRAKKPAVGGVSAGGGGSAKDTKKDTKAVKDNTKARKDNNEEINKQLSGLDKLNVLHADEAKDLDDQVDALDDIADLDDDLGGIGGGIGALGDLFEEVPIDKKILDWLEKFREMWEKADFSELGELLANKLADILEAIPWDIIKDYSARIGKSIGTLIDGFFKVERLAKAVGKTVGEALNTIQIFLTNLLENINFTRVGRWLSTALMTAFETIDWDGIGHLIALGLNSIFNLIDGILQRWDDDLVSDSISTMINRAFTDFNWSYTASIVGRFFRKLFNTIKKTLNKIHFDDLGKGLTAFLSNKSMWDSLFIGITDTLNSLFNALQRFMDGFDGIKIAKQIASSINAGLDNFEWKANLSSAFNFVYGFFDTMLTLFEDIDWGGLIDHIFEAIKAQPWGNFVDRLIDFFKSGILQNIAERLSTNIIELDWPGMGHKFADGLESVFNTAWEISERFDGRGILQKIVQCINTAIADMHDKQFWQTNIPRLANWLKGLLDALSEAIDNINFDTLLQDISEGINNANIPDLIHSFSNFITKISETLQKISDNLPWEEIQVAFDALIDLAIDCLVNATNNLSTSHLWERLGEVVGSIDWTQKIIDLFSNINIDWGKILTSILSGFADFLGGVTDISQFMGGNIGGIIGENATEWIVDMLTGDSESNTAYAKNKGTEIANSTIDGYDNTMASRTPVGLNNFVNNANQISQGLPSDAEATNKANGFVNGYDSKFTLSNLPNVTTFSSQIDSSVTNGLPTPEQGASLANGFVKPIDNGFAVNSTNTPNVTTFGNNIKTEVTTGLPTSEEMSGLGTNIVKGLEMGMTQSLYTVGASITPGLNGIIDTIRTIFQVHSPSVLMQNIGRDIVQGLINGWTQNISGFMTQITNFGTQFANAFNSVKSRVLSVISSMVSSVRNALSSLASMVSSVISQISNAVSNVGNQVSNMANNAYRSVSSRVTIPRHATGQVIPPSMSEYLAILGDNNKETEVVSPLSTMKQAMIEAMGEMSMYGFGGGNSGDIVIQIDGREVFRAVQNQNSQYYKQTGANAW